MRNMSFSMTTDQIRNGTKTVTRRLGWKFLKPGELVRPVVKGMGLKKGEKVEAIRGPLRIKHVQREELNDMVDEPGATAKEGFIFLAPTAFVDMFCKHMKVYPDTVVTRIEFEYTDEEKMRPELPRCEEESRHACMNDPSNVKLGSGFRRM